MKEINIDLSYIENNVILKKSLRFSVDIVNFCKKFKYEQKEYELARQLVRSGTSIGANANEAEMASSRKDFINKMTIALKEAYETRYWLLILWKTKYLEKNMSLLNDIDELIRILVKIVKSSKEGKDV